VVAQTSNSRSKRLSGGVKSETSEPWTDKEVGKTAFQGLRLGRRFRELLKQMGGGLGESIPLACQDWANTKAAYRFFANDRVNEGDILSGQRQSQERG
jgi:Transposase DNA-binding